MKLGNFNGGYKILDFVKAVAYATGSASTETISGLYNRVKEALLDKSKPLVLHDLIIDVSGTQTLIGDTFIDRANASVDASKAVFFIGVGSNNVKITVTSAGALNADVYEYAGGAGGVSDLDDLSDVDLDNPTNGQVLKYNSTTEKWENADESGGGGSADYQIIDVASETLWADLVALDLTKPVFLKRGTYCVPVMGVRVTTNTRYVLYFVDMSNRYSLTVSNTNPVSFSYMSESLSGLFHYYRGNFMNASATIATGEYSEDVTVQSGMGSVSTIVDLLGETQIVEGSFGNGETRYLPFTVELTDVDAGITAENVPFVLAVTYNGSGSVKLSDAEVYVKGSTNGYNYRVVPNKTLFDLNAGTPEEVSFTVYREVTEDVYSTSEVLTNKKWIDGKPVYRKVVSLGTLPNNSAIDINTGLDYATTDNVMLGFCGATNGISYTPIPFIDPATSAKGIGAWVYKQASESEVRVKLTTDTDWSGYTGYAIIYFTKVTT